MRDLLPAIKVQDKAMNMAARWQFRRFGVTRR